MYIAYLIMAHHQLEFLSRLVARIVEKKHAYCFIHIDKKADISPLKSITFPEQVIFLDNRIKVTHGAWSQVQVTLNLMQAAVAYPVNFQYYQLLSGSCFPIKSKPTIKKYLTSAFSFRTQFIEIQEEITPMSRYFDRISQYFHGDVISLKYVPGYHLVYRILKPILKRQPLNIRIYKGSTWWCLTDEAIKYILSYIANNPRFVTFFKYTSNPDEIFFHTILRNSKFADDINSYGQQSKTVLANHYIDWEGFSCKGSPRILCEHDSNKLFSSSALFARKFDANISHDILEQLEKVISDQ